MFCRYCGAHLANDAKFCVSCGAAVSQINQSNSVNNQVPQNHVTQQTASVERETVNSPKATAALVTSIIGFFGIFVVIAFFIEAMVIREDAIVFAFVTILVTTLGVFGLVYGIQSIAFAAKAMREKKRAVRSLVFGIVSVSLAGIAVLYDLLFLLIAFTFISSL